MDGSTIVGVTAALLVLLLLVRRVERRALGVFVLVFVLPLALLIVVWAHLWGRWPEVGVAAGITLVIAVVVWALFGRRLTRASSDSIQVWGQEKMPRPTTAEAAEMRAELLRLKDEKLRLEAEVQRLKDAGDGQSQS